MVINRYVLLQGSKLLNVENLPINLFEFVWRDTATQQYKLNFPADSDYCCLSYCPVTVVIVSF